MALQHCLLCRLLLWLALKAPHVGTTVAGVGVQVVQVQHVVMVIFGLGSAFLCLRPYFSGEGFCFQLIKSKYNVISIFQTPKYLFCFINFMPIFFVFQK
jgi:uncharacterized integral membrane protein